MTIAKTRKSWLIRYFYLVLQIWVGVSLGLFQQARGNEIYTFVVKKQEEKKSTRWSLQDWLETRDRMRMMDIWLALHSSSPYEFFVGGDARLVQDPAAVDGKYYFSAFASIFGLGVEHETYYTRTNGAFFLRVLGFHNQGTNITLHAGIRIQNEPFAFATGFAGGALTFYMTRFFGIETIFRYYFPVSNTRSAELQAMYLEANGFVDFRFLRIYAGYHRQSDHLDSPSGYQLGARFFF
jgi:hypothetical protein